MQITRQMFEAYLSCPFKCFQYRDGVVGQVTEFSEWHRQTQQRYEEETWSRLCGLAIRDHGNQVALDVMRLTQDHRKDLENIGVGGITSPADAVQRLETGVKIVQLCTAVNLNPLIGEQIRKQLASPANNYAEARFEGEVITFSDANVKITYKITSEVCKELGVPFDIGLDAVRHHWLDRYQRERGRLKAGKNAARGKAPDKTQIHAWIRYTLSRGNRR